MTDGISNAAFLVREKLRARPRLKFDEEMEKTLVRHAERLATRHSAGAKAVEVALDFFLDISEETLQDLIEQLPNKRRR